MFDSVSLEALNTRHNSHDDAIHDSIDYPLSKTHEGLLIILYVLQKAEDGHFAPSADFPTSLKKMLRDCRKLAIRNEILRESVVFREKVCISYDLLCLWILICTTVPRVSS